MTIPMMLGMPVNMIYNLTDTFFIGKLNDTHELAAISLLLPFATFLMVCWSFRVLCLIIMQWNMETMFLQDLVFLKKTVIYQTELITGLVVVLFIFRRFVVTCFSHDTQVIYIAAFILTIQFFYLSLQQVQGFWQEFFRQKEKECLQWSCLLQEALF